MQLNRFVTVVVLRTTAVKIGRTCLQPFRATESGGAPFLANVRACVLIELD
jgi:hypothetical protein